MSQLLEKQSTTDLVWTKVATTDACVENAGVCIKLGETQIAIFNFNKTEWYATQNLCPHQAQMVLSRGIIGDSLIGDAIGEAKVACPLHKNQFSLKTGKHLGANDEWQLTTYAIKVEDENIYLELTPELHQLA